MLLIHLPEIIIPPLHFALFLVVDVGVLAREYRLVHALRVIDLFVAMVNFESGDLAAVQRLLDAKEILLPHNIRRSHYLWKFQVRV